MRGSMLAKVSIAALVAAILPLAGGCAGGQGAGSPGSGTEPAVAACSPSAKAPLGTLTASGDHYVGYGLDVTAAASLDPNYGVNGTIDLLVTVSCPTGVTDVGAWQSYEAWGSTVGANLQEVARQGDTWSFALFADDLSGSHPFDIGIYRQGLSGSGKPAYATIVFKWPASLVQHMAE